MPTYRTVFQFYGGGTKPLTFNEVYYVDATSPGAAAATMDPGFIGNRLACLDAGYFLKQVRISDIAQARVSLLANVGKAGTYDTTPNPAPPDVAVVLNLASSAVPARRKLWMRGIGSGLIKWDPVALQWGLSPGASVRLSAWIQSLETQKYTILAHHKASELGFAPINVTGLTPIVGTQLTSLTTAVGHNFVAGNQVNLARFSAKDFPGLNGVYTVIAVPDNTHLTIAYTLPHLQAEVPGQGKVRLYSAVPGATIDSKISGFAFVGVRKSRDPIDNGRGSRRSPLRGLRLSP